MTAPLSEMRRAEIEAGRHQDRSIALVDAHLDVLLAEIDRLQRALELEQRESAHQQAERVQWHDEAEELKRRVTELETERHDTNTVLDEVVRALRTKQGAGLVEAANELERRFIVTGDRLIHRTKLLALLREWAAARTGGAL